MRKHADAHRGRHVWSPCPDGRNSILTLYADDPERADRVVFGRFPHANRRGFLQGAGLAAMGAMLGAAIPFHRRIPAGFVPEALARETLLLEGKDGLTVLNDRPLNAETPAHLLDDDVTPTKHHFIRKQRHSARLHQYRRVDADG